MISPWYVTGFADAQISLSLFIVVPSAGVGLVHVALSRLCQPLDARALDSLATPSVRVLLDHTALSEALVALRIAIALHDISLGRPCKLPVVVAAHFPSFMLQGSRPSANSVRQPAPPLGARS